MRISKIEMEKARLRSAKHYANLPGANFPKEKAFSLGGTLIKKAKAHKGFKIV